MALILSCAGKEDEEIKLEDLSVAKMQQVVEGYIERIVTSPQHDGKRRALYVNEEGRLIGLPYNSSASNLANFALFGNAILLTMEEEKELNETNFGPSG